LMLPRGGTERYSQTSLKARALWLIAKLKTDVDHRLRIETRMHLSNAHASLSLKS
jgi:hypothetical protein